MSLLPKDNVNLIQWCLRSRKDIFTDYISLTDFFENQPTKFAVIWVKRRQKAGFLSPRSSKITLTKEKEGRKRKSEEKERRRRKGGEEKKAMVALLVVIIATVEIGFGRKKLLDTKAPLRDNGFKNPARYIDELLKTLPPNRSFPLGSFFLRSKTSPE